MTLAQLAIDSEESDLPEALHTTTATRLIYNEKKRKRAVQTDDVRPGRRMVHKVGKYSVDAPTIFRILFFSSRIGTLYCFPP